MKTNKFTGKILLDMALHALRNIKLVTTPIVFIKNWWFFYPDYFGLLKEKEIEYKLKNNIKLLANTSQGDSAIINEIWGGNIYTPSGFDLNKTDIVVDIGAHKGYFTIAAYNKVKNGRIYAFEPVTENFNILKRNISINKCHNVKCFELGIAGSKGIKRLFISPYSMAGISILPEWFDFFRIKKIKIASVKQKFITLNEMFSLAKIKKIDFLKIDCEGAEYEIFFNSSKKTLNKINKISMEYHKINKYDVSSMRSFLEKNGFEVKIAKNGGAIGMLYAKRQKF